MSGALTPPSSINDARTKAHLTLGARLGSLDLTQILVYVISNVDATALPALAWQFDVQSPFWTLLSPGADPRQLIESAIPLHSVRGTPAVITEIVNASGFSNPTILEGQNSWGGNAYPSNEGWAVFRVLIPRNGQVITATIETQLVAAINFFRPAARPLDQLAFTDTLVELPLVVFDTLVVIAQNFIQEPPLFVTDFLTAPGFFMADIKTTNPTHNAHFYHAGLTYGGTQPAVVDSGLVINGVPTEGSP